MGGRREYGARLPADGELPLRLQREAPTRRLGQGQILRADAPALRTGDKTGTAHPAQLAIALALRTGPGLAAAAQRAGRDAPVMILAPVEAAVADRHRGDFRGLIKLDQWRGEWGAPIRTQGFRSRPHGDGSQALAA